VLRADQMGYAERTLLETVARAILRGDRGDLRTQLDRPHLVDPLVPAFAPTAAERAGAADKPDGNAAFPATTLSNGVGGFADGGGTYVIVLNGADETPMPWTNVIANPRFGTIITASGSAHTWSANSRENRLTPFANDPTSDPTAEALFIRDDESGDVWSPTPGPLVRTSDSGRISGPSGFTSPAGGQGRGGPGRGGQQLTPEQQAERNNLPGFQKSKVKIAIAYAEWDPGVMGAQMPANTIALHDELCKAGKDHCPEMWMLKGESHMSEVFSLDTSDQTVAKPVLKFVKDAK